jgi:hypothetical protein
VIAPGHTRNALALSGTGCLRMSVPTSNAFTIAFWARPSDTSGGALVSRRVTASSPASHGYLLYDSAAGGGFGFAMWDGTNENDSMVTSSFEVAAFHHYAVTFDGSIKRWYVDGAQVLSQAVNPIVYGTDGFQYIGCDTGGNFFAGMIDELYFFNGALSDAQIVSVANAQ